MNCVFAWERERRWEGERERIPNTYVDVRGSFRTRFYLLTLLWGNVSLVSALELCRVLPLWTSPSSWVLDLYGISITSCGYITIVYPLPLTFESFSPSPGDWTRVTHILLVKDSSIEFNLQYSLLLLILIQGPIKWPQLALIHSVAHIGLGFSIRLLHLSRVAGITKLCFHHSHLRDFSVWSVIFKLLHTLWMKQVFVRVHVPLSL